MARRTKQDAEKTRQAIIDAAVIVLSEHGLTNTTLNKVAQQAGVTRGAIYWHFRDRDDLFLALSELAMAPLISLYEQIETAPSETKRQLLLQIAHRLIESVLRDSQVQQLGKLSQQWVTDATFLEKHRPHRRKEYQRFERHMQHLQQDGILLPHLTPKAACLIFTAYVSGIFEQWTILPESLQIEDIPGLITSLDKALFVQ